MRLAGLEANLTTVAQAFPFFPTELRLEGRDASALLTFMYLTEADVFIASDSSFSWMATFMSTKPIVIVAPEVFRRENKRENLGERCQHILADVNGSLISSTIALQRAAAVFSPSKRNLTARHTE